MSKNKKRGALYTLDIDVLRPDGSRIPVWFKSGRVYFGGDYVLLSSCVRAHTRKTIIRKMVAAMNAIGKQYKCRAIVERIRKGYKGWIYEWGTEFYPYTDIEGRRY